METMKFRDFIKIGLRLLLSLIIFVTAIYVNAAATTFMLENVFVEKFTFEGFEEVPVKIPSYSIVVNMSAIKFLTILTGITIFIVLSILVGGFKFRYSQTAALLLSSFLILGLTAGLQMLIASNIQPVRYGVIYAELGNVSFYNADFLGVSDTGEIIRLHSPLVMTSKIKAYRAFENGSMLGKHAYMSEEELLSLLKETKTFFNMSDVSWYENDVVKRLDSLCVIDANFSGVNYDKVLGLRDVRINEIAPIEGIMILLSLVTPFMMSAYIAVGFKRIYMCGTRFAIGVAAIVYLLLMVFATFFGLS